MVLMKAVCIFYLVSDTTLFDSRWTHTQIPGTTFSYMLNGYVYNSWTLLIISRHSHADNYLTSTSLNNIQYVVSVQTIGDVVLKLTIWTKYST